MTDRDLLRRFQRVLAAAGPEAPASPTPACLDDDVVAALAEGSLDPVARAAVLPHLASCAHCRGAVASVARALSAAGIRSEIGAAGSRRHGWPRHLSRVVLPLAAASAVLLLAWPSRVGRESPHRAPTITAAPAPTPVSPVGAVADARRLVWIGTAGADRYRVTLFDSNGAVVFETETSDTTTLLPDSVALQPGHRYLWKAEARTSIGRWTTSDLVDFSLPSATDQ